jgi:hypothetical protein
MASVARVTSRARVGRTAPRGSSLRVGGLRRYKPLVDESNPALREARLRYVAQRYLRPETLAAANARIVDVHAKLPPAERWGGGEVASIDGLRFVVPRRTIHAAYNRRYFDRRRGVTLLGTTADHYAGLHTSTWFSQLAWTGRWTRVSVGQRPCSRLIDAFPR